ncbi:MAG: GNAT family N-acetyltransferase [Microscillaceae bacterium]|nr:GNAT family N-acetyltransferase [Microscillaceae bacterium]
MQVNIYDKANIAYFNWNDYEDGVILQKVFEPLIQQGTLPFIANVDNEVQILVLDKVILPLVIGNPHAHKNAYICSTLSQYFDLAIEEIMMEMKGKKSIIAAIAPHTLRLLKYFFKLMAFEKVVFVNNFILSTNLYPRLDTRLLREAQELLVRKFPQHALVFRSVSEQLDAEIHQELLTLGFDEIISRPVLTLDPSQKTYLKKRMYKMDQKLWEKNKSYYWDRHESIQPDEIPQICELYADLYLKKYSSLNPQYRDSFIQLLIESKLLNFKVLRKNGKIFGVTAFLEKNGVLTTPLIGYDQSVPIEEGLYRFLNYKLMQEAIEKNIILNMSSGAANFKRLRGGETTLEYNMVYSKHLALFNRIPWQIYHLISTQVAIPGIRKYGL